MYNLVLYKNYSLRNTNYMRCFSANQLEAGVSSRGLPESSGLHPLPRKATVEVMLSLAEHNVSISLWERYTVALMS